MFNKFKNEVIEKLNERILEYVLNTPDIWLEVLRIINNKYENKIFSGVEIKDSRFNQLKIENSLILGAPIIRDNTYIPKDDNLTDIEPFIVFKGNIIEKD